jgi:rhodanese-related sulfurtransferase
MKPAETNPELPFELSPVRVAELVAEGSVEVVDVREHQEREAGHLPGSRHVPLAELTAAAPSLPADRPIVFVCRVGARSGMAAFAFARAGFDAHNLTGGLIAWAESGLPLAPEGGTVAAH